MYLNAPVGYPFGDKIEMGDESQILRFCLNLAGADEDMQTMIRESTHEQRVEWLKDSHFTFDEQFYGYRPLPERDGVPQSALDDPSYRASLGMIERPPLN